MYRAILVAGDEERFTEELDDVRKYLDAELGVTDVELIQASQFSSQELSSVLEGALQKPSSGPILFVYSGHGGIGQWGYTNIRRFKYSVLAELLQGVKAPLLFVNDCCHAYSVVDELRRYKWKFPVGLIAAATTEETVFPCIYDVLHSWKNKKPYDYKDYPHYIINMSDFSLDWKEVVVGGWRALWRNRISRIMHWVAPRRFKISLIRVKVVFPEHRSTPEEAEAEKIPHYVERPRWGDVLDHYFYYRQLRFDF